MISPVADNAQNLSFSPTTLSSTVVSLRLENLLNTLQLQDKLKSLELKVKEIERKQKIHLKTIKVMQQRQTDMEQLKKLLVTYFEAKKSKNLCEQMYS
jgi:hypothetical protein